MMKAINDSHNVVDVFPSKPSCQWVIQMGLQTSIVPDRSGKRLFVMDSFYGRHKVGSVLEFVTQGEAKILSTIKLSNVNNEDKPYVKKMLEIASKLGLCSCFLLQVTISGCVQRNCGYIIFKDKRKYR